jgi:hypothetical protein
MLWLFKDLARQLTNDTGLPCVLPGEVVTEQQPHFEFAITGYDLSDPEPGDHEHDEQINAKPRDLRYAGTCDLVVLFSIELAASGASSDFAAAFMRASLAAQRAGLRSPGVISLQSRARSLPRSGASIEIIGSSLTWPSAGDFLGRVGNIAIQSWECRCIVPVASEVDYVVEDIPGEDEGGGGPAPGL